MRILKNDASAEVILKYKLAAATDEGDAAAQLMINWQKVGLDQGGNDEIKVVSTEESSFETRIPWDYLRFSAG